MENILNNAAAILILLFLIITFFQSGIDKIIDWKGNLGWLQGHFMDTPLKGLVPFLLATILLAEVIAAVLCSVGIYQLIFIGEGTIALYGAILSCIALLMLLKIVRLKLDWLSEESTCCCL